MPPTPKKKTAASFTTNWQPHKATDAAIAKFEEAFGKEMGLGVLTRSDEISPYEVTSFGPIAMDVASGIGGLPVGAVVEVWGPEHAGKTTAAMLAVANAQKERPDKMAAWVDMEQTFDKRWAQKLGVDLTRLWLVENPQSAEDVADATKRFVMSGLCSIVVLDSVGSMIGRKEFEKESEDAVVAEVAKIVTRMVKQVSPMGKANGTTTWVVNQVRAIIATGNGGKGPTTHTSGGWALKHVTAMRLNVKRGESQFITVDGKQVPVSHDVIVRWEKNKMAPYGRTATFNIRNTPTEKEPWIGVDPVLEAVEYGKKTGIITGSAWLTLPSGEKFNGATKAVEYLKEHPEEMAEIRARVLESLKGVAHDESEDNATDPTGMLAFLEAEDDAPFGAEEKPAKDKAAKA